MAHACPAGVPVDWHDHPKVGPCRICAEPARNGRVYGKIQLHRLVLEADGGSWAPENVVPLCPTCRALVVTLSQSACVLLFAVLEPAELDYVRVVGGDDYPERVYMVPAPWRRS